MTSSGNDAHPTINDVAERAGVSRATASRALADYGVVNGRYAVKINEFLASGRDEKPGASNG